MKRFFNSPAGVYLLVLAVFLTASSAGLPEESERRGERVRIYTRTLSPLSGELLSANFRYMTVLMNEASSRSIDPGRDQRTVVLVHYEIIDRLRIAMRTYNFRRVQPGFEFQRFSLYSRYTTGMDNDTLQELLEEYDQEDLYEIRR